MATEQAVSGFGTVVLDSGEVDVECSGTDVERSVRTMPDAFVQRLDSVSTGDPGPECATVLDDGRVLVVPPSGGAKPYLSASVSDGEGFVSGEAPVGFVGSELSAAVELRDQEFQYLGDAVLSLRVAQVTGTERCELRQQHRIQFFTRMDVPVTGTVQLPTGDPVAVSCAAERTPSGRSRPPRRPRRSPDVPPVRALQAVATVGTVAGADYLVQVCGPGGESGPRHVPRSDGGS